MGLRRLTKWAAALLLIGAAARGAGTGMRAWSAPPELQPPVSADPASDAIPCHDGRRCLVRGRRHLEALREPEGSLVASSTL